MNTQDAERRLRAYREAIDYASRAMQIQQFMQAHAAAGALAMALGQQAHGEWLSGTDGNPHGFTVPGRRTFTRGAAWLMERGWRPSDEDAATILTYAVLENPGSGHHEPEVEVDSLDLQELMAHLAGLAPHSQAMIVSRMLEEAGKHAAIWRLPLVVVALDMMCDPAALMLNEISGPLEQVLAARKSSAQARLVDRATMHSNGTHRIGRL